MAKNIRLLKAGRSAEQSTLCCWSTEYFSGILKY